MCAYSSVDVIISIFLYTLYFFQNLGGSPPPPPVWWNDYCASGPVESPWCSPAYRVPGQLLRSSPAAEETFHLAEAMGVVSSAEIRLDQLTNTVAGCPADRSLWEGLPTE
jgi:hypothetical protein